MRLGEKIKRRRKEISMTQIDLAEGICTQAMVSRLEKQKVRPSRDLMEKLADRMDTPMSYFYGEDSLETRHSQVSQLCKMIRQHLERREYDSIAYLVETNYELIARSVGEDKLFFEWIKGLLYTHRDGDYDKALDHLIAIEEGTKKGELRVEIIDSIGNQYQRKEEYNKAEEYYQKGFESFSEWMGHEKKAKLLLNYSLCLSKQEKYRDSLEKVLQGLELLIENNTLFLLGDFFYQKGHCLEHLDQSRQAVESYKKAAFVFDIQQNERFITMANLAIDELEEAETES
ncbi:tetratricopeptide repeat protein [Marinilactibacillus psychrotolerans]|uniref:XRE family transcriptional regulator n=1 Tax=Marinilactibacillus psychrotolerans TaxID=191770 RepID=A0AAV3WUV8_9LACT|nr:tetratricopeptide repeat protein [Marinilactibacillus psychrotolerans]GEL67938.1 transcriptional regulator [Marinilactibacillus psychrotolerans]GEQ34200.1 XRE family transcriptional regulator [Marinilactibacillus psychrotolerans]GEQ35379.1 XRE family transcriptional regulator [Marinilactibacillus psychrotolerans]SDD26839.1 Tetratricopeptide repeat-containing protein [Marinilactibacillus psychrotolerans]